ncbi:TetR/AcrR family transcriptional regulator [Lacticaseibacillus sharpeae]|uniref:TetR AcrR family transcriptional regulator n=2 Tax=Lacticaseibacillus sharpeae TaxID=1626 RepID=A0A0R1ZVC8_9LACO|nr:TetR family transcriptional regulator [Lacticaseibacillus sharpeae]KRM54963.1 TetR AcrR family transcriptional regulator [Lacticaseibacillus sharpeae JCM 1186 = DSM 20505]
MPKSTFFRLPEEKRNRLLNAARTEFGRAPFAKASVSNIIELAGIPRGSFYQYFEDKQDIFFYMLEIEGGTMVGRLQQELIDHDGDVFATFHAFFDWLLQAMSENEHRDLFRNIITEMDFRTAAHTSLGADNKKNLHMRDFLATHVDFAKLNLERKSDLGVLMHIAFGNFMQTITHYYNAIGTEREFTTDDVKRRVHLALDWLENGVARTTASKQ